MRFFDQFISAGSGGITGGMVAGLIAAQELQQSDELLSHGAGAIIGGLFGLIVGSGIGLLPVVRAFCKEPHFVDYAAEEKAVIKTGSIGEEEEKLPLEEKVNIYAIGFCMGLALGLHLFLGDNEEPCAHPCL